MRNMHSNSRHSQGSRRDAQEVSWHLASMTPNLPPYRIWIFPFTSIVTPLQPRIRNAGIWSTHSFTMTTGSFTVSHWGCGKGTENLCKGNTTAHNWFVWEGFREEPAQAQFIVEYFVLYLSVGCSDVLFNCLVCFPNSSLSQGRQGTPTTSQIPSQRSKESQWELKIHYNQPNIVQKISKQDFVLILKPDLHSCLGFILFI